MAWSSTIIYTEGHYGNSTQLGITVSSVMEEFKVTKCRLVMTLKESAGYRVARAVVQTRTGRKLSVKTSVDQAESMLYLRDIIGNTSLGRQGVGMSHFHQCSKASTTERRLMVQAEVRCIEENQRKAGTT